MRVAYCTLQMDKSKINEDEDTEGANSERQVKMGPPTDTDLMRSSESDGKIAQSNDETTTDVVSEVDV